MKSKNNIKEIIKPEISKIILTIVLLLLSYYYVIWGINHKGMEEVSMTFGHKVMTSILFFPLIIVGYIGGNFEPIEMIFIELSWAYFLAIVIVETLKRIITKKSK